jgi:hypothetical protein
VNAPELLSHVYISWFFFHLWHSVVILTVDVGNIGELHLAYFPFIYQFVDCRSQQPRGLRRRSWPLGYWDHRFESRSRYGCFSSCFSVALSCVGRGFCDGLIIRPKESYQVRIRNLQCEVAEVLEMTLEPLMMIVAVYFATRSQRLRIYSVE